MSRIDDIFATLRAEHTTALMPFITAGYPSLDATRAVLPRLQAAGAAIVEIGFPFSDPIADGPVIAASMHEALQRGIRTSQIFELIADLRSQITLGLMAMVSQSIVGRMGHAKFVTQAAEAGFDGLIVPDIDLATADDLRALTDARGLSLSLLIAPNTTEQRLAEIVTHCSGFVYLLARVGITGESETMPQQQIAQRVQEVRKHTDLPIAVGFGISTPEHVRMVTQSADAAIVGSALVRRMGQESDPVAAAEKFVRELAAGLHGHRSSPVPAGTS